MARGFGAGGPRSLDGWHAAQELGARGFGWVVQLGAAAQELRARRWIGGTRRGVWMGGTGPAVLDGWHAAQFGWAARVSGAGGPAWSLDGYATQELGARRVWMGGTQLRNWGSWGPAEFGWVARGFGTGRPRF